MTQELDAPARKAPGPILQPFDWDPADLWHDSPVILNGAEPDWHSLRALLYPLEAILWLVMRATPVRDRRSPTVG